VTLSHSPVVVLGTNSIVPQNIVAEPEHGLSTCQNDEVVPRGTTAVRLWVAANVKPKVRVEVLAGLQVLASGTQTGGWLGKVVTVPIAPVTSTIRGAQICLTVDRAIEEVDLLGGPVRHPRRGESPVKVRVEYLRTSPSSWWSLARAIARRMSLGRAPGVGWVALIPLAAMALAAALAAWTVLRQLGRDRAPRAGAPPRRGAGALVPQTPTRRGPGALARWVPGPAWACAAIAFLSAASWSIVSPPFQVTDEPSHFAYAQILAETWSLPRSNLLPTSLEERVALRDLGQSGVRFNQAVGAISSAAQQLRLQRDLRRPFSRVGQGAGVATPQPPLYYALETIPYYLGASGTLLDQLALMRLLSALLAAVTAIFAYLFLREALPAVPWAWTVGGLCAALAPLLGFISGAVNPDALLCTVATALFYCLARAFRRGLSTRLAVAIGVASATGFLTKLNFIGLAPGILLALLLLARRAARTSGRAAYRPLATALAIGASPVCLYVLVNIASHHAGLGLVSRGIAGTGHHRGSPGEELSYIWQSYLPRLPGMADYFPGISTIRQLWFDRLVGLYGWLDTHFPNWVYEAALLPAALIAALCLRELVRVRAALRARAGELLAYAAIGAGLLALIGVDSYLEFPVRPGAYSEPRYLLPFAALYAAALALAARGAGRRWGPAVGALLVLLILAHDIFSQLQVIARFYG
jgi:hypothetical protein